MTNEAGNENPPEAQKPPNPRKKAASGIRKHGNKWQWNARVNGERVYGSADTLAAAKAARSEAVSKGAKGEYVHPSKMTLAEYWEKEYLPGAKRGLKESTIKDYGDIYRWRIEPHFGSVLLPKITSGRISSWLTALEEKGSQADGPLSQTSVTKAYVMLNVLLGHAVSHGVLGRNPCQSLEHKPTRSVNKDDRQWWTAEILEEFLYDPVVTSQRVYPMVVFVLDTGARRGEICGLRWSSVDLDTGYVTIEKSRVRVSGVAIFEGPPKSRKGKPKTRRLSLSDPAVAVLRQWKKAQLEERMRVGPGWKGGDFVFTTPIHGPGAGAGRPYAPEGIAQAWSRVVDKYIATKTREAAEAGLEPPVIPRPTIHEARHSYLSAMVAAGEHLMVVAQRAGHSDTRMVDQVYSHLAPKADKEAANRVASLLHKRAVD